jgi:hypothetical protein
MRVPAIMRMNGKKEEGMNRKKNMCLWRQYFHYRHFSLPWVSILPRCSLSLSLAVESECVKTFLVRPLLLNSIVMPFHRAWEFSEVSRKKESIKCDDVKNMAWNVKEEQVNQKEWVEKRLRKPPAFQHFILNNDFMIRYENLSLEYGMTAIWKASTVE